MAELAVPGLSAVAVHEASIVWERGFGVSNTTTGQPVTPQTIFEAASLSKPVVAYAALQLCDEGRLELDRPLARYLSSAYLPVEPLGEQITLRQVLSHSSGLTRWRKEGEPLQVRFAPGTRFGYSGEGYMYLQHVMEHLSGQSLAEFVRARVLEPLEMRASSYVWREEYDALAATGHEADGSPQEKWRPQAAAASNSLHTTPSEYARFMLACRARAAMFAPQVRVAGPLAWGLGWGLNREAGGPDYWHWGDNMTFTCFALGWREASSGLVLMTNSVHGLQACRKIVRAALGSDHPAFDWMAEFYREIEAE
jgi:CubicO group peptidase (beta-lactamase class C family)